MATIGVIDYGMGNLHSIAKALEYVSNGDRVVVSYDPDHLKRANRLVLPGVGAIGHCMDELRRLELNELVGEVIGEVPVMGICLGMQVLLTHSEESNGIPGLDVFPGEVRRFPDPADSAGGPRLKVPHMGWNQVQQERRHPLWEGIDADSWFYFVHSYHVMPEERAHLFGSTHYGLRFASTLLRDNVFAVQFHPEKSQATGLTLLSNFLQWDGKA